MLNEGDMIPLTFLVDGEEYNSTMLVEHIDPDFVVLSDTYGVVSVVSDKRVVYHIIDTDSDQDMEFNKTTFDYKSDGVFVKVDERQISVYIEEDIPFLSITSSLADLESKGQEYVEEGR